MALMHTCKDGTRSKLTRTGPVGDETDAVRFTCPRCGYAIGGATMVREFDAMRAEIVKRLAKAR
jgi:predicted RNA-binding Zn-ribbon protein involved in translation (DUF1610 family)